MEQQLPLNTRSLGFYAALVVLVAAAVITVDFHPPAAAFVALAVALGSVRR